MVHRIATWAAVVWTVAMALGILAAFLGIGRDCGGLTGNELSTCQTDSWLRGGVGLALLVFLWSIVAIPLGVVWSLTRPKGNVIVFGPAGQQVLLSEAEAERRVKQQGWSYTTRNQGEAILPMS